LYLVFCLVSNLRIPPGQVLVDGGSLQAMDVLPPPPPPPWVSADIEEIQSKGEKCELSKQQQDVRDMADYI
jgi:hypothetical protein